MPAFIQYLPSFKWPNGVIENNHRGRERNVLTSFMCAMMWEAKKRKTGFLSSFMRRRLYEQPPTTKCHGTRRMECMACCAQRQRAVCPPDRPGSAGLRSRDAKVNNSPAPGGRLMPRSIGREPEKRSEVVCLDY